MRVGPRMSEVVDLVEGTPGISMRQVALRVGPHGSTQYGYRTVHRVIKAGLVRVEMDGNIHRLYPL